MRACLLIAALCFAASVIGAAPMPFRFPRHAPALPASRLLDPARPGTANCSERFFTQKLDHFTFNSTQTYEQRYFLCHANGTNWAPNGTVFFYTGNECDITLFVNMTGLMWENAVRFNAVLVFAEHRYFGKSLPYPSEPMPTGAKLQYLTTDQAMADYSTLINYLRFEADSAASPVIAFGGSYGGMLAAWMRIKYPDVIDGSIAGSAPIVNFEYMEPKYPADAFNEVVTFDATPAAGSKAGCAENVRQSWQDMMTLGATAEGRAMLDKVLMMCEPLNSMADISNVMNYASQCFGNMAMSSYPFPSSYLLLGGRGMLPAYPMRVGCEFAGGNFSTPEERLAGFMKMILVYYNATGDFKCLNPTSTVNKATEIVDYLWGYLACNAMFMPSAQSGTTDMFWSEPWNTTAAIEACQQQYGITPQPEWVKIQYGGWGVSRWGSNIFFSNGGLDPWRPGGITHAVAPNITAHIIPDMGHHVDLMFSDPHDTPAIRETREMEMRHVERWVAEKRAQWGM